MLGIPTPRPGSEFRGAAGQFVPARIAEEARVFGRVHIDGRRSVEDLNHDATCAADSTGLNWQPSTKKSKKLGCVSRRQCSTRFTSASSSARLALESSAMHAPSMAALPICTILES